MRQILLVFILVYLLSVQGFAIHESGKEAGSKSNNENTTLSISGYVEDMDSSEKLVCAKIEITDLDLTIFTDIMGNFSIPEIKPGIYDIKVSYISYEELEIEHLTINDQQEIHIQLKPL